VLQAQRTEADGDRRRLEIGKKAGMRLAKDVAPIDVDVVFNPSGGRRPRPCRDEHQGLVEQLVDMQPRCLARLIHDPDVEKAIR
jgi:hypothetical protein